MARLVIELPPRRVVQAFQALFTGSGSQQDASLVLEDLELHAGLWAVTTPDTPDGEAKYAEGQRSVLGRIQALMRVTAADLDKIEAARQPEEDI